MKQQSRITDIVMDFDGTCTQIPNIYEAFLTEYLSGLNATKDSQQAAWTIATSDAAPAAADPYIFSFECVNFFCDRKK